MLNHLDALLLADDYNTGSRDPWRTAGAVIWIAFGSTLLVLLGVAFLSPQIAAVAWRVPPGLLALAIVATSLLALAGLRTLHSIESRLAQHTLGFERQSSMVSLIFKTMTEGVVVYDAQMNALYKNPRAEQILGDDLETPAFLPEHSFFIEDGGDERQLDLDELPLPRALRGETSEHLVIRISGPRVQGAAWFEISTLPLRNRDGVIIGAMVVFYDATERQRIVSERQLLASVVESSADAVMSLTPDGLISSWNPASERLFGFSEAEAVGQSRMTFVPPQRVAEIDELSAHLVKGESVRAFETSRRRKDGSEFPALLSLAPILSAKGKLLGYSEIIANVSESKREVAMREARDVALEAVKLRSQFLANMSHEIRTPLNAVLGMAQLLMLTQLDDRQREYAQTVWSSGDLLLSVVNDILDFSKLTAGKMSLDNREFDLATAAEAAVESLAARAKAKHLELALAIDPEVPQNLRGDPNRLRQVLINLIGNAIKFTDHGEVVVRVKAIETSALHTILRFTITDTGIGIAQETLQRLFQPFTQADGSTARKYGGTGLGLAICRQLVEKMRGSIGVDSTLGNGSVFHFTARFENSDQPDRSLDAWQRGLASKRVLVVDNNESQRVILANQLAAWNLDATHVESGVEALTMMREAVAVGRPFHVALIDMNMRGMNGRALAHAIRSYEHFAATRLVILASLSEESSDAPLPKEVDAWLVKPFKRARLIDTLCALVSENSPSRSGSSSKRLLATQDGDVSAQLPPAAIKSARILLVEDDLVNQSVALSQLEHLGYKAEAVDSGAAALRALHQSNYDVVLMDCQMPLTDGYQTTALIRQEEGTRRHTNIVAMTAHAMDGDREKCLAAGMDDYVSKPVDLTVLSNKLKKWLSRVTPQAGSDGLAPAAPLELTPSLDSAVIADLREISKKCGRDVLRQTAEIFFAEAPKRIADLKSAIGAANSMQVAATAHRLKSAAVCVGLARVGKLCAEIESRARQGDTELAGGSLREVETEISHVRELLLPSVNGASLDELPRDVAQ
jgi:PAS domain S-box-containing protein